MENDRSSANTSAVDMPEFNSIPAEKWIDFEAPINGIINRVRPTSDSEDVRNDVVRYMKPLIENVVGLGAEVLQYGSVPLKTYLPEGDIDLTVVSVPDWRRDLPHEVYYALMDKEQNGNDEYKIKDVRYIDAEVKLVKCAVNNIEIDISFNQMSGLCALCFLEQLDRLIGKNHLFKRSIILIKAWCYYESHILGAVVGLFSTYALETLVLCIFCVHYPSLTSPLMVLYRFMEYYNELDWDNFGISIDGPFNLSLLPDIVVESPINHALLSGRHMRDLINLYTVPCNPPVGFRPPFTRKVMNIADPLKTNNNLGRSVHTGNFFHIKRAFGLGASKLFEILELPREKTREGILNFFGNTLRMNESKCSLKPRLTFDSLLMDDHDEDDIQSEVLDADLESEDLNLADLSGDYHCDLRSLLLSQCTHIFSYLLVHEHPQSAVQSYPNHPVMLPATNLPVHQSGTYIRSPMGQPTRASGRGHGPPFPNRELNWAQASTYEVGSSSSGANTKCQDPQSTPGHGQSSGPSQVPRQRRRLEFGSFGRGSMICPEPEQANISGVSRPGESVMNRPLPLMDDNEFPPLKV